LSVISIQLSAKAKNKSEPRMDTNFPAEGG